VQGLDFMVHPIHIHTYIICVCVRVCVCVCVCVCQCTREIKKVKAVYCYSFIKSSEDRQVALYLSVIPLSLQTLVALVHQLLDALLEHIQFFLKLSKQLLNVLKMSIHVLHFSGPKRTVVTWGEVHNIKWIRKKPRY
jgi:hypothetical protein